MAVMFGMTAAAAPLEAYGRLPSIEAAVVSPDGTSLAVVVSDGAKRTIVVQDIASGTTKLRGFVGDQKVRGLQWAGNAHLALTTTSTENALFLQSGFREWAFGNVIDVAGKKIKPMMPPGPASMQVIFGPPAVRVIGGRPMIFVQGIALEGDRGALSVFRIDPQSGVNRMIRRGAAETQSWLIGPDGEPTAQELYNGGSGEWTLRVRTAEGWRDLATKTAMIERPYLIGMGRDASSVLYGDKDEGGRWIWKEAPLDGGPVRELPAAEDEDATIRAVDGRLIGQYSLVGDEARYTLYDPADARAWAAIAEGFGAARLGLASWSQDRRKMVVLVDQPAEPPAFALIDMTTREAIRIGDQYAGLTAADIGAKTALRFKAADGTALSGYLTLPPGRKAGNLPLIVLPHGGPAARDRPGFDWWAQGMASRGYAVLQVNYRGSAGLGRAFTEAGYGQWGRKMQTDLSDGVRHLATQGAIDPKRVCIVGGSYGGYAALAGATIDREPYRCAVSLAGISDLRRMVGGETGPERRYWKRFMGADGASDPILAEISPITHVDKVTIPLLLIHGKDDTVVPLEQSQIMAEAMRKAGKPVELLVMTGEDHWLSRGETRQQMLKATMAFIEKHNPPN